VVKSLFRLLVVAVLLGAAFAYFRWHGPGRAANGLSALRDRVSDAKVAGLVRAAFAVHRDLARCEISVTVEDSVVTLRGGVPDEALRARAEALAVAVPQVRHVVNHLRVSDGAVSPHGEDRTLGERIDDRAIEVRVRLALSLDRDLAGTSIAADVFRKQVTLSGEVANAGQAQAAVRLARETLGVVRVVNKLHVQGEVPSRVERVRTALTDNGRLTLRELVVREQSGRIALSGWVPDAAQRDLAVRLAERASGGPVENRLQLSP
jgi:hyperosmotically inducible protein